MRGDGVVDHLWIRVADLGAACAFYETLAPAAGWSTRRVGDERAHFRDDRSGGSFALVADGRPRTEHAHLAVAAADPTRAGTHVDPDGNRVELRPR